MQKSLNYIWKTNSKYKSNSKYKRKATATANKKIKNYSQWRVMSRTLAHGATVASAVLNQLEKFASFLACLLSWLTLFEVRSTFIPQALHDTRTSVVFPIILRSYRFKPQPCQSSALGTWPARTRELFPWIRVWGPCPVFQALAGGSWRSSAFYLLGNGTSSTHADTNDDCFFPTLTVFWFFCLCLFMFCSFLVFFKSVYWILRYYWTFLGLVNLDYPSFLC
jgi:hypothetical protein